jgi:hypothetical protein
LVVLIVRIFCYVISPELLERISLSFWLIPLLVCQSKFCLGLRFLLVGRSRVLPFICILILSPRVNFMPCRFSQYTYISQSGSPKSRIVYLVLVSSSRSSCLRPFYFSERNGSGVRMNKGKEFKWTGSWTSILFMLLSERSLTRCLVIATSRGGLKQMPFSV